ncbi:DUF1298 domain-containing protein [Nakamurella antarctica]|uniref:diacylglycerol O-acyltransferase n=1 Tax=Nakamurella antarctica TaxID=1902245 RepID=A0A3G8ZJ68_9ACTN|nr:wax ester/triacylglycerol synthase domain-containing protein [Nakamurella antarctica]AZI57313.1 DUF1298 domain-containing protein [Nakamurella antarctica]
MTRTGQVRLIQRTTSNDLMALATESAVAPMQVAAILVVDRLITVSALRVALAERILAIPRLRQRLQRAPFGCGRPVWIDDANFAMDRHVDALACPAPGTEDALLAVAATAATRPLPRDHPLWSLTLVTGLEGEKNAAILVIHHVLADGIGGLAALALLIDGAPAHHKIPFPTPPPTRRELFADATTTRIRALGHLPAGIRLALDAVAELRGGKVGRLARCTLNQPTGSRRQLAVARTDMAGMAAVAHARGATINDVLLTAVAGSLAAVLRQRGESAETLVLSVPVSSRGEKVSTALGNHVGAMLVRVSTRGEPIPRLQEIACTTRVRRQAVGRGASAILLAPAFRMLRMGLFRWLVDRQRLVTTFVTNLSGFPSPLTLLGAVITDIIPITAITGNVTVGFAALSYAGTFAVTVVADPERCPDLPFLVSELQNQLTDLTADRGYASTSARPVPEVFTHE